MEALRDSGHGETIAHKTENVSLWDFSAVHSSDAMWRKRSSSLGGHPP